MKRTKAPRSVTHADTKIGERLRVRRVELEMSQDVLAQKLGISFQQIQKYEKGVNRLSADRLVQIAKHLDTTVNVLLGLDGSKTIESDVMKFMSTRAGQELANAYLSLSPSKRITVLSVARDLAA